MLAYATAAQDGWELAKKTDKISVYSRPAEGYEIDEFKGVCEDDVRIEVLGVVLENIPGYVDWIDYLAESMVIRKDDEDNMVVYQRYNVVWPFYDRDCIAAVKVNRDYRNGRFVVQIHSISDPEVPVNHRTTRISFYEGEFVVEYVDRRHCRISYRAKIDFGGSIPAWFGSILSRSIPFRMLNGLVRECRNETHQNAAKTSVLKMKIEASIAQGHLKE